MEIYDKIVSGLEEHKSSQITTADYLRSLQTSVKLLRQSYYSYPVQVPYHEHSIQAAYLIAYFPHYYQLIYSILNSNSGDIFKDKHSVDLGFIGGGPGSEVYGVIIFIINNCSWIKKINITILDINAETWKFSHQIVLKNLIGKIKGAQEKTIVWNAVQFDLINLNDVSKNKKIIQKLDFLVIQNCINEIQKQDIPSLKRIVVELFQTLPSNSYLLVSDLTSSVRLLMKSIELELERSSSVKYKTSTLGQPNPVAVISIHHKPNSIISNNLMTRQDGLIPRKNIKYDYILISRTEEKNNILPKSVGLMALFSPLRNNLIDANNFVNTKSFIGLDFGTSTTVLSYANLISGKLEVKAIPIPQKDKEGHPTNDPLIPTVMGLVENVFMVGRHASERKSIMNHGKDIWYGFKENLDNLEAIKYEESLLKNNTTLKLSNAKEALIVFFKYLKKEVVSFLEKKGLPIDTKYTVSIPANFDYEKKTELRKCLTAAGIPYDDAPFIEEPTAALINYLYESQEPLRFDLDIHNILILDIGAGTVDISIMRLSKQIEGFNSELLSVARKGAIGGNLLDEMIYCHLLGTSKKLTEIPLQEREDILKKCETLKIKICREVETDSTVNFKLPDKARGSSSVRNGNLLLDFENFHSIMSRYWIKVEETINDALLKAKTSKDDISLVIFNGGGSRNPYIQSFTRDFFANSKIVRPDNIQEHVSKGAALNSIVLNSYGKQIVSSILNCSLYLWENEIEVIKAGETLPTFETTLIPDINRTSFIRHLNLKFNDQATSFIIPANCLVQKCIVLINIDNEPECTLITSTGIIEAERTKYIPSEPPLKVNIQ